MSRPPAPAVPPPPDGDVRYRMTLAYDGAAFHGFAPNPGVATVVGTLVQAMGRILGHEPLLAMAGRTDAGVHGWGQVVSFDAPPMDTVRFQRSVNALCAPAIVVRDIEQAADDFDARFSARSRTYRYQVLNRAVPDPFLHALTWHVHEPLDLTAMNTGAAHLLGEHDFGSFCRKKKVTVGDDEIEASLVREVLSAGWSAADDDVVELWITATAFCHQMVRSITGTLVDVGLGRIEAGSVPAILAARDRNAAGRVAPPHGLTLWSVGYD
ncbi:MAG: tRNA pseudouridine(38-40) synthase TruA [Acidimicrobiales bacterium]